MRNEEGLTAERESSGPKRSKRIFDECYYFPGSYIKKEKLLAWFDKMYTVLSPRELQHQPVQNSNHKHGVFWEAFLSIYIQMLNIQPLKLVQVLEDARQQDWYLVIAQIPARGEGGLGCEHMFGLIWFFSRIIILLKAKTSCKEWIRCLFEFMLTVESRQQKKNQLNKRHRSQFVVMMPFDNWNLPNLERKFDSLCQQFF